ncbi:LTA synthase family protein [Xylanibacter brevis]|uniref:LTA synthase family protein n=1 Tax=Xylanibacter brevis TaxID=83231 RepID=UPI000488C815|nr:LTA synthase family protein [Xylanibacter brevis]
MRRTFFRYPVVGLVSNLFVIFLLFTFCRLVFLLVNWSLYADTMTWGHAASLFAAGLIFDTTAILYTNALVILLMLFPLHWKERKGYYQVVKWIYVVCNSVAIWANLCDCVYFPYTGKRTTTSVFYEFSHEGVGGMTKIMGEQFLANWYLVLLAFALSWLLWKVFRPQQVSAVKASWRYYVTQTVILVAAVPLVIAGMRGGFSHAVRPITISNANQFVDRPAETGIVLNTPFSIYRTLSKKPLVTPSYMSEEEALSFYTPIHVPNDSVAFQPKNVVVLILESWGKQHMGYYNQTLRGGAYKGFTPFVDSLIAHGAITWRYSYSNGRKSIEGMPSTLSSLPNYVEPLFLTPASLNHMSGLARELGEKKGYTTAFFHGAQNNSMGFQAFARATGFQRYYGRTEYNEDPHFNGDKDFDGTWAIWDEEFMQFYVAQMNKMKQPFMTALFSATSHTPFNLPARYKNVFPKGEIPLQECVAYTDHALRQFFKEASKQPWFKNTLFVLTADHSSSPIDPFYKTTLGLFNVPIILYAPGDESLRGYDTQRVVEQIDIMPTVLAYLHYDQPYLAFGKDMLHTPAEETHALHWVPESNGYEFVKGPYVLEFDGQEVTAAYRYRTDSVFSKNILMEVPADTLQHMTSQMKSIIQQYMYRMNNDKLVIAPSAKHQ